MGRVDRRRKKKKLAIWQKILIVLALFVIAGFGGYFIGNLTGSNIKDEESSAPKTEQEVKKDKEQEVHKFKANQMIPLDDNVSIMIKDVKTYPKVDGPKFPIGITVKMVNHGKKAVDMPYKYLFRLFLDDKNKAQSIGIYTTNSVEQNQLTAETEKLKSKEERTVVYMFSAPNRKAFQSNNATLKLSVPKGQQIVSLKVTKQKGTSSEKDTTTTQSSVVQSESTSTTYEQTTQATVSSSQHYEASTTQQTQQQTQQTQTYNNNNNVNTQPASTQQASQVLNTATIPVQQNQAPAMSTAASLPAANNMMQPQQPAGQNQPAAPAAGQ